MEGHPQATCSAKSLARMDLSPSGFLYSLPASTPRLLCECPTAATTKCHKLRGLEQREFSPGSGGMRSENHVGRAALWLLPLLLLILGATSGPGRPGPSWACGCMAQSLPLWSRGLLPACLCVQMSFFCGDTITGSGPSLPPGDLILTLFYLQRPYFQTGSHSQVQVVMIFWEGTQFNPLQPPTQLSRLSGPLPS